MPAKKSTIDDLPVFKSYPEFRFQEFKKRKKLLFFWSCIHWSALTIQNIFQLILRIQTNSSYLIEILLFVFYFLTWVTFNVFLKWSAKSYKWYNLYEYAILCGTVLLSPLGLWYASSQSTTANMFQYYVEVSLSIQCFFFLTQRAMQRAICYACYVISTMVFMVIYFETYEAEVIIRKIVFSIAVSCSFGVINSAFEAGSKNMLKGLQEFWKSSFEIIPHGVIMLDNSLNIKFKNTGFENIFDQSKDSQDKEQITNFCERLATLRVLIRQDISFVEPFVNQLADRKETGTPTLLFNDFLRLEVSKKSQPATICGDCKINNKSIEVKALRTTFEGSGDYYVAIFVDTTERDRLAKLQDQNEFKDSLLKSVSHELRGPLNASIVSITKVLESTTISLENKKTLDIGLVCQFRLLKSIDGILDLAKANSRQLKIKLEEFDIQKSIQRTARLFDYLVGQKNINFNIKITQNSNLCIHSDPERIEQILYQLLDNAVKFTNPHGSVTLEANVISTELNSSSFEFIVRDTGCGLSAEEVEKVNTLLSKGAASDKVSKNSTGIGLGLMVVAALLSRLGSDCKITSEPKKGTIFYFRLKNFLTNKFVESDEIKTSVDTNTSFLKTQFENHRNYEPKIQTAKEYSLESIEDQLIDELRHPDFKKFSSYDSPKDSVSRSLFNNSAHSPKIREERNLRTQLDLRRNCQITTTSNLGVELPQYHGSKILIVDDDAFNLFALESRLKQIGHVVLRVYNGKAALEILKEMHPSISLILMDLNMPVMDGYEATKLLKQMMAKGEMSSIPIIACTAYAQETEQSRCFDIGFDDFAVKPLDSEKLSMILKKFAVN